MLLTAALTGCSALPGGSDDLPDLSGEEAAACADLVDALPDPLAGEDLAGSDDRTASWGGIELTCGVEEPEAYDEYAACLEVGGVGWFVPESELEDAAGRRHRDGPHHHAVRRPPRARRAPRGRRGPDARPARAADEGRAGGRRALPLSLR